MTKAQRQAIERLKKKHRCSVVVTQQGFLEGPITVKLLGRDIAADERERVISKTGIVQETIH